MRGLATLHTGRHKSLAEIPDGEHTLGGIAGEAVRETTDTHPARLALVADAIGASLLDARRGHQSWSPFSDEAAAEKKASLTHKG